MKIKGRPYIDSKITKLATDKSTRNKKIQSRTNELKNSKMSLQKSQSAMVASWFSPQKYKGFKSNFK